MKKQHKKLLVLNKEVVRALDGAELLEVVGGGGSVGAHGYALTCECPPVCE